MIPVVVHGGLCIGNVCGLIFVMAVRVNMKLFDQSVLRVEVGI